MRTNNIKYKEYTLLIHHTNDKYDTIIVVVLYDDRIVLDFSFNNGGHLLYVGQSIKVIQHNERTEIINYVDNNYIKKVYQ